MFMCGVEQYKHKLWLKSVKIRGDTHTQISKVFPPIGSVQIKARQTHPTLESIHSSSDKNNN